MILAALALAMQVVIPTANRMSYEDRVAALAEREASSSSRLEGPIFEDPALRAELRRVGFAAGCSAIAASAKEVIGRHAPALQPGITQALRNIIPVERVENAPILSLIATGLQAYRRPVENEIERTAGAPLAAAREDMRRTFLAKTGAMPSNSDPAANVIAPRPDVAESLGHKGNWDTDNPAQMEFACAEQRISPRARPTITTGERG